MSPLLQWHFKCHLKLHWQGGGKPAVPGKRLMQFITPMEQMGTELIFSAPGEMKLLPWIRADCKVKIQPLVSREVQLVQLMTHSLQFPFHFTNTEIRYYIHFGAGKKKQKRKEERIVGKSCTGHPPKSKMLQAVWFATRMPSAEHALWGSDRIHWLQKARTSADANWQLSINKASPI